MQSQGCQKRGCHPQHGHTLNKVEMEKPRTCSPLLQTQAMRKKPHTQEKGKAAMGPQMAEQNLPHEEE